MTIVGLVAMLDMRRIIESEQRGSDPLTDSTPLAVGGLTMSEQDSTSTASTQPLPTKYRIEDLTGRRYGRLTVLFYCGNPKHRQSWLCRCDCGIEKVLPGHMLKSGKTKSCGCFRKEVSSTRSATHRLSGTKIYDRWTKMIARCHNPKDARYPYYGARGIFVCDRWRTSVEAFIADMGEPPTSKHTVERIDNNGPYCPENCRWATQWEQSRNTRTTLNYTFNGKTQCLNDWASEKGMQRQTLKKRIVRWGAEIALQMAAIPVH